MPRTRGQFAGPPAQRVNDPVAARFLQGHRHTACSWRWLLEQLATGPPGQVRSGCSQKSCAAFWSKLKCLILERQSRLGLGLRSRHAMMQADIALIIPIMHAFPLMAAVRDLSVR